MDSLRSSVDRTRTTRENENRVKIQEKIVRREQKCKAQAQSKIKNSQIYTDKIYSYKLEIQDLSAKINARTAYYKYAGECAIKIQKVYRGHLTRHLYSDEVLIINGFTLKRLLIETKNSDDFNLFYTGRRTVWAAKVINRFMKRMVFLLKIRRIQQVYMHLKALKNAETCRNLRMHIRLFVANIRIKHEKFLIYRSIRLQEIRKNLAILTVKNYYISTHLTYRILRKRIILYKRKFRTNSSHQSKTFEYASTRDRMTSHSDLNSVFSGENLKAHIENLGNILECASITSTEFLELEKERKEKIHFGYLSYNIPKAKESESLLPFLYQKDMKDAMSPTNYCNATANMVNRMNEVSPKRFAPKRNRKMLPAIKKRFSVDASRKKIVWDDEDPPNFTLPTASSSWNKKNEEEAPKLKKLPKRELRNNTSLFNSTITAMLKVKDPNDRAKSHFRNSIAADFITNSFEKSRAVTRVKDRKQPETVQNHLFNINFMSPCDFSALKSKTVDNKLY